MRLAGPRRGYNIITMFSLLPAGWLSLQRGILAQVSSGPGETEGEAAIIFLPGGRFRMGADATEERDPHGPDPLFAFDGESPSRVVSSFLKIVFC